MKEKMVLKWQSRQKIGKFKFILLYGVLCFGLSLGVIQVLLQCILNRSTKSINFEDCIIIIIIALIGGIFYGFKLWDNIEYEVFRIKYLKKKN